MHYVYLILCTPNPRGRSVGYTEDLGQRIIDHNRERNTSTAPHRPWRWSADIAFSTKLQALEFQRHMGWVLRSRLPSLALLMRPRRLTSGAT